MLTNRHNGNIKRIQIDYNQEKDLLIGEDGSFTYVPTGTVNKSPGTVTIKRAKVLAQLLTPELKEQARRAWENGRLYQFVMSTITVSRDRVILVPPESRVHRLRIWLDEPRCRYRRIGGRLGWSEWHHPEDSINPWNTEWEFQHSTRGGSVLFEELLKVAAIKSKQLPLILKSFLALLVMASAVLIFLEIIVPETSKIPHLGLWKAPAVVYAGIMAVLFCIWLKKTLRRFHDWIMTI